MADITELLRRVDGGDRGAMDALYAVIFDELRGLARGHMAHERGGATLSPTALVHEAWIRLAGGGVGEDDRHGEGLVGGQVEEQGWQNRRHFFKAAANQMRQILVDRARARGSQKRGGGWQRLSLDRADHALEENLGGILDLHDALTRLEAEHPQKARLVELRFFGGLTQKEAAMALDIPATTAERHWRFARARLAHYLSDAEDERLEDPDGPSGRS